MGIRRHVNHRRRIVAKGQEKGLLGASQFPIVEVDSSYYALPTARNSQLWVECTRGSGPGHHRAPQPALPSCPPRPSLDSPAPPGLRFSRHIRLNFQSVPLGERR